MFIKGVWLQMIGTLGLSLVLIVVGIALSVHADIAKWEWYVAFTFTGFCGFPLMGGILLQCMGESTFKHQSDEHA
jgi:bacteriorhodopsin